jgi:hypothetical protein
MPLLISAQKHQWTKQPPYNFYHFPEEHRAGWQAFWNEMKGDIDKILEFAKKADIECPNEWCESLHIFLFDVFAGNPKLLKKAAGKTFGEFLNAVIKNHKDSPKEKQWYTVRGITQKKFIAMLERGADIQDIRQAVAFINARVKDLGFHLYSEFLLSKTKHKSEIKNVASEMNKKAYELECEAIGHSPLEGISEGDVISHALFPNEKFMITEVANDMLVTRDSQGKVAFIKDFWNVVA